MDEDQQELRELERDIGQPDVSPAHFEVGRLAVVNCGLGWLKVVINHKALDCEAELLPPEQAKHFIKWIVGVTGQN